MTVLDHSHRPEPPKEPPEIFAPDCVDQLPVIARVGRGLRGDSFKVVVASDEQSETYLEGLSYDPATKTWQSEWMSENINGGQMMYQYNLRPYTIPQTFTITFRYKRPNRSASEWQWTTPAIPYIWDADNDGLADVDSIVGTGVATLFMKKTTEASWVMSNLPTSHTMSEALSRQEKLLYPDDWDRDYFNAPKPGEPWTVNLQYGVNGDIDAPNVDDLAKIIGITVQQIRNIVADQTGQLVGDGFTGDNVKDYIDKLCTHIHADMGFDHHLIGDDDDVARNTIKKYIDGLRDDIYDNLGISDPSSNFYADNPDLDLTYTQKYGANKGQTTHHTTVKAYIDARCDDLQEGLTAAEGKYDTAIQAILNKMVGGGTLNADGTITWNSPLDTGKLAAGNINLYSGTNETLSSAKGIFTHTGTSANDDIKAV